MAEDDIVSKMKAERESRENQPPNYVEEAEAESTVPYWLRRMLSPITFLIWIPTFLVITFVVAVLQRDTDGRVTGEHFVRGAVFGFGGASIVAGWIRQSMDDGGPMR